MANITMDALMNAVIVILTVFAAIATIDKAVDIFKKWKQPTTDTAKKLAADKERIDQHDKSIKKLQESNQVLCVGVLALLDHELHNGNADQMQQARDDIMHYLQGSIAQ